MEQLVDADSAAMIRDGNKSVARQGDRRKGSGATREWPYMIVTFKTRLPINCYANARKDMVVLYQRVMRTLNQMKRCLASGWLFVFGSDVYESFEIATVTRTGHAALHTPDEAIISGRAVAGVGYKDVKQRLIARNSRESRWGGNGCLTLPCAYLDDKNLLSDYWTIRIVK